MALTPPRIAPGAPLVPFDTTPAGTVLVSTIMVGRKPDGSYIVEHRLAEGLQFDEDDPVHCLGSFIAQNAQQIAVTAAQYRDRARAAQGRSEERLIHSLA